MHSSNLDSKYGQRLNLTLCYVSSEDDGYCASNLRSQTLISTGWQSSKNCEYPQELGFFFDGQVNLNSIRALSHESKISSCIDVFVADISDEELEKGVGASYEDATFTRLGHVRLSPNDENDFEARELKTIGIRRRCVYLKLLFNRPYINAYNLFGQVGLVGICAYGSVVRTVTLWSSKRITIPVAAITEVGLEDMVPFQHEAVKAPVLTSPVKFVDTYTMNRLNELSRMKQKAIVEEDYDLVVGLSAQINAVKEAGVEIDKLTKEKAKAVEEEDYMTAKSIKRRIEELRSAGYHVPLNAMYSSVERPSDSTVQKPVAKPTFVLKKASDHDETTAIGKGYYDMSDASGGIVSLDRVSNSTVPLEGLGNPWEKEVNSIIHQCSGSQGHPDALSGEVAAEGVSYESDLGVYAVACLLSRVGLQREAAIRGIFSEGSLQVLQKHSPSFMDTILTYLAAKGRGTNDPVAGVVIATCECLRNLIGGKLKGSGVSQHVISMDKVLHDCVSRIGDSNGKVRENMEGVIMALAQSSFGVEKVISILLVDPNQKSKGPAVFRVHLSRINLLSNLVDIHGVRDPSPLSMDELFNMVIQPNLQHPHREVRDAAMKLLVKLFKLDSDHCATFLDRIKPAQLSILEDQMKDEGGLPPLPPGMYDGDSEPQSVHRRGSRSVSQEASKMGTPRQLATPSSRHDRRGSSRLGGVYMTPLKQKPYEDDGLVSSRTCQFCRKFNEEFTEANLDIHYIRSCPMLCPCPLCDQVTEIATLQNHLVTECEAHDLVRECPRCREAVRADDLQVHVEAAACIEYVPTHSVCPLCHGRFKSGMEAWRKHLTVQPGCVNNPRKYDGSGPIM